MEERGLGQSTLARAVGVSQSSIWKLLHEPKVGTKHVHRIAALLGTTPAYLMDEVDVPDAGYVPPPSTQEVAADLDLIPVREFDLSLGMGGAFLDAPVAERVQHFPRSWIRNFTSSPPDDIFFAHAIGDSMMPTMLSGDIVLIDRRQRIVDQADLIWAFTFGGLGMIKRIGAGRDGTVRILSDNQAVRTDVVSPDDLNIIGRIVAIVRRM